MSVKRPSVTVLSDLIQKYVGSDFDKILALSQQLDIIAAASGLNLIVDYTTQGYSQETLGELLNQFAADLAEHQITIDSVAGIEQATTVLNLAFATFLNTSIRFETADVSAAEWVTDDATMALNSSAIVPTQKAVRKFVKDSIGNSNSFQGGYDPTTNIPNLQPPDFPAPNAVDRADSWTVTVVGNFFGSPVNPGDKLIALIDDPLLVSDWVVIPNALNAAAIRAAYLSNYAMHQTVEYTEGDDVKLAGIEAGATTDQDAFEVPFDSTGVTIDGVELVATEVQAAIAEVVTHIDKIEIDVIDGSLYSIDPSRANKLLSVAELTLNFSKEFAANNMYLKFSNIANTIRGYRVPKDATLIGVTANGEGNLTKGLEIHVNSIPLNTFNLFNGAFSNMALDEDIATNDFVQIFVSSDIGADVENTLVTLYFKWRK